MERAAIIERLNAIRPALHEEGVKHLALFGSRAVQLAIVQQAEDDLLHGDWMQND